MPFPKRALVALTSAGMLLPATLAAGSSAVPRRGCPKTFTLAMFARAASRTYAGARLPRRGAYGHLWRYARCQRPPSTERRARRLWHRKLNAWAARRDPPMSTALVSWYQDGGSTASGWHAAYGVADCGSGGGPCYAFGTRLRFCYRGCVTATVDDHGPYVAGRSFDLSQSTAQAIGFGGVGVVRWRVVGRADRG